MNIVSLLEIKEKLRVTGIKRPQALKVQVTFSSRCRMQLFVFMAKQMLLIPIDKNRLLIDSIGSILQR